jgi:hypothetical protein
MRHKLALAAEVMTAYVPLLGELRSNDLRRMVAVARTPVHPPAQVPYQEHLMTARRLGTIVHRLLRLLPSDQRCLIRSLVMLRLLEQRSIPATLVIGVANQDGFQAHAWVEFQGVPVLPPGTYERLMEL